MLIRSLVLAVAALSAAAAAAMSPAPIGLRVLHFVDRTRAAHFRTGEVAPRRLVTYVRYPRAGHGPFPLVVFAHGFDVLPGIYAPLLDAWAHAGYVVAAPVFPVESPTAPGGADESDLINQPGDIRFVITQLLRGPLHALIDPGRIAVAGQSDGGETVLAAAYADRFRDPRIDAAIVLSGAQLPNERFTYGPDRPPLLAVQGTADTVNRPFLTADFFRLARRPKFLLWLLGAEHLPPYTTNGRELGAVERVTTAFLDHYLRGGPLRAIRTAAAAPGVARLVADP